MDKFKAVWLSHSSIGDYLKCPRLYYLRNIYKDLRTNHKFTVMTPPLALGQVVHEVVEGMSALPLEERLSISPLITFEQSWEKVSGEKGGFKDVIQEKDYKERGVRMLQKIIDNPGPILKKAVKIKTEDGLPYYWFSESDNIILCGKIDWMEYIELDDSVHIIDFKTGRHEEDEESLQLPIYLLLSKNLQKRVVSKASYWYLDTDTGLIEMKLPSIDESVERIGKVAARIKLARQLNHFECKEGSCRHCFPFERVLKGEGKLVGVSEYGQDIFVLNN